MERATIAWSGPIAEPGQEIAGLHQRQADHVGIGADDLGNEGSGGALDGVAAGLAAPLAAREVVLELVLRQALEDHCGGDQGLGAPAIRSEEHTSELQSLMSISYAVFCLKTKQKKQRCTDNMSR